MPLCNICGGPLTCANHAEHASPIETPCALDRAAIWVHVMDDAGGAVVGAEVDLDGTVTATEASGFARFDDLDSRQYTATLSPLSAELARAYDPSDAGSRTAWLAEGEVGYLSFKIARKARLTVKVAKKNEPATTFGGATVRVTGKEDPGDQTTEANGIADFEMRSAGDYTIEVQLAEEDADEFFTERTSATLAPGVDQEVLVEAQEINVITPEITTPIWEVWFRPDEDANKVVELTLTVTQTNPGVGYTGKLTVTCSDTLQVYEDKACTTRADQLVLSADTERVEVSLWAKKDAAMRGSVEAALTDGPDPRATVHTPEPVELAIQELNVVKPEITTPSRDVWFNPAEDADQAVEFTLVVTQTQPGVGYTGKLAVTCSDTLQVYMDKPCTTVADQLMLSAKDARVELPLWAKKGEVAQGRVKVALVDDPGPRAAVVETAPAELVIEELNVIMPVITGDELVLVYTNDGPRTTTHSEFTLDVAESKPDHTCADLEITITYGAQLACFEDAAYTTSCPNGTAIAKARLPLTLYVKGATEGDCPVTASAGSASGASDPSWVFGPAATLDVRVEQLELDAYTFRDGRSHANPGYMAARVGAAGLRELHAQNGAGDFTNARLVLKRPSARFWQKATQITLATPGGVQIYSDPAATAVKADVQQGDFAGPELELWVKTTAPVAMDVEPGGAINWGAWAALLPTKVMTRGYVSCGATTTVGPKQLVYGSIMALDTFGFDKHLDRVTRNECGNRVTGGAVLGTDMALSRAGGHEFYDHESGFKVNKNFPNAGGALFQGFLNSMNQPVHLGGNNVVWSQQGRAFVANHLLVNHAIVLHATTQALIEAYILHILSTRGHMANYGFSPNFGVPGVHAEVLAVDELLTAGVPAADITVATYKVGNGNVRGKRFIACTNCRGILIPAVRVITG